ncbi:ATP-binding cassette domain-containing protein [Massilia sp. TS11]|uniref:ATP-binding cassette domain-containing protein n=1 Tax=Massilia sp. TS11 TaxID=2908003 RepID=UPI001EDC825B|nr:ATP-binding cassette domain-containing protein [Massilia sp. TS11]MCG2583288.1 ATP-binding cassette domain-containing protein [Massilia sp. TS11]
MIRFTNVSLMRGTKPLFESVDLTLNPGDRIGLVGANGAGKSSLFAMLRGDIHADQGDIDFPAKWRVAHVAQETPALERTALDYAIDGDTELRRLQAELAQLESAPHSTETGIALGHVHSALADADAYTVSSRAEQLLLGLGFTLAQMQMPVASFSGGWRMRLNLAQALMCPSDLLLLDEPTNHLDLDAIIWLEDWLKRYAGTLIIISHDRDFLDEIVNVVVHIDERKLKRYSGNYTDFERQRAAHLVLAAAAIEKQQRERAHLESFINRFRAKATKARQAQSRMKALAKMEELAPLRAAAAFSFEFREPAAAPNPLLVLEDVDAGYGERVVVKRINFTLQMGQRIGLLGQNGAGKSTFIKTIAGALEPLAGKATLGKGLQIGYFAQHQVEMLRHDESPLWHMMKIAPEVREQELRNFLGGFNFPGEMVSSPIAPFSGGEKARLALALIVWQRPNLLLLDEPTNHLDLETREALTMALAQFEGTLVLVSHDRHLLRATTDQFMIVSDGQLQPFDGDLDDYKQWLFETKLAQAQAAAEASRPQGGPALDRKEQKRLEAEARQRLSSQRKPLEARLKKVDAEMAKLSPRKAALDAELGASAIYEADQKERLKTTLAEQASISKQLEQLEEEWLSLQEQLDALS